MTKLKLAGAFVYLVSLLAGLWPIGLKDRRAELQKIMLPEKPEPDDPKAA